MIPKEKRLNMRLTWAGLLAIVLFCTLASKYLPGLPPMVYVIAGAFMVILVDAILENR